MHPLNTGMNKEWTNVLAVNSLSGTGTIKNFSQFKEFIVFFAINGFVESNYMPMNVFQKLQDGVVFTMTFYYNSSIYGHASIQINKSGYYTIGYGMNGNSSGSNLSVWAR